MAQREANSKRVAEIERLNQSLKSMYEKKVELLTTAGKEDQAKAQKYRAENRLLKEELVDSRTLGGKLQKEANALQEKLVQLTKSNSQLEKQSRHAYLERQRDSEKLIKESGARQEEAAREHRRKIGCLRSRLEALLVECSRLQGCLEDTRLNALEYKAICKQAIDEQVRLAGRQLMAGIQ